VGTACGRLWPDQGVGSRPGRGRREDLKHDVIAYHEGFRSELGVAMPREYLVTIGIRK
jgi:hypothetical protein